MRDTVLSRLVLRPGRLVSFALTVGLSATLAPSSVQAADQVYFSSNTNITNILKTEFYWLASQGIPIRLRFNPTWFPEIDHWKAAILNGQHSIAFGSANFAPTELAPVSSSNYGDDSVMLTDDPELANAFKTKFDVMWNDTTREPSSILAGPPYLKNWDDACTNEPTGNCSDHRTQYPNPVPMIINTARLEPDYPMPADMYWGQGPKFNNRLMYNDAVWVQFSDALAGGASVYPLNSTSGLLVNLATDSGASSLVGWGWQNTAYWLSQSTTITFASSGTHILRIQVREDGVQFDQIVLSPSTYLNAAPGPVSNDNTIVAKP